MIFDFFQILKEAPVSKSGEPDQTLRFAASDLVLHCLPMSHKKDARLIWVKNIKQFIIVSLLVCFSEFDYPPLI